MFCSFHFSFFFCGHFWRRSYKIRKFYVIYVYILQDKMGKTEENRKENHPTKVTKIPKTNRRKYGMNETLDVFFTNVILWYPFYFLGAKTHRTSTILMNNMYVLWLSFFVLFNYDLCKHHRIWYSSLEKIFLSKAR